MRSAVAGCGTALGQIVWRSYQGAYVGPARFNNSNRIYSLMRAGTLYLTVQDALALAIENNLDLEIARYSLPSADWGVERAQAGGPIRGSRAGRPRWVRPTRESGCSAHFRPRAWAEEAVEEEASAAEPASAYSRIGPVVINYDPSLTGSNTFSHITTPFANLAAAGVNPVVDSDVISTTQLQQGLSTGGTVTVRNYYYRQTENSPFDSVNPALGPNMRFSYQQPFLQGYGTALNSRGIRVARNGVSSARENFRGQLIAVTAGALNLYWSLVSAQEEWKTRQRALETTQKFAEQTKYEIDLGALAKYQLPRAEAEAESRKQDLILAEATVRQREDQLKLALTRREDPLIENAHVVCLDSIEIPAEENLPKCASSSPAPWLSGPMLRLPKLPTRTPQSTP